MLNIDLCDTGKKLKTYRKNNKYSAVDLATALYVTDQAVYKWERGDCLPSLENLVNICDIYKCKISDLLVVN